MNIKNTSLRTISFLKSFNKYLGEATTSALKEVFTISRDGNFAGRSEA